MRQIKNLKTSVILCILLAAGPALSADLDAAYSPTRAEWLRIYLAENIKITTDSWALRVRVMVTVASKNKQVLITLKPADGQKKPTKDEQDAYSAAVAGMVKRALGSYEWSKDLDVRVSFV